MRLRLPTAIALALLVGVYAVLFDRVALRGLALDGAPPPAVRPVFAPPPLPHPLPGLAAAPAIARPPPQDLPIPPLEERSFRCHGRCDAELANYRTMRGNLAARAALEACTKKWQCER
jgi:hypothetical protein